MTLPAGTRDDYGNPLQHDQVMTTRGIYVDCGLKELLEALWAHDFATAHSCQGGTEASPWAYVALPSLDYALCFIGGTNQRGGSDCHLGFHKAPTGEWLVRWDPEITEEITRVWTT